MKIYFDENIISLTYECIKLLKFSDDEIISVTNTNKGIKDIELMKLIHQERAILVTYDKKYNKTPSQKEQFNKFPHKVILICEPKSAKKIHQKTLFLLNKWLEILEYIRANKDINFIKFNSRGINIKVRIATPTSL